MASGDRKDYWEYRAGQSYDYKGETFYTITPIPYYYRRREELLKIAMPLIADPSARSICDFGCGDGWYIEHLSGQFPDKEWYGVDLSAAMIERAQKNCPGAELRVSGDGIPFERHFDLVYSFAVFAHVMDDTKVLELFRNISEKLVPGGRFLIFEQTRSQRRQGDTWCQRTADEYVKLAGKCGMEPESRTLIAYPAHRLFTSFVAPIYYRFLAKGRSYHERCLVANRSAVFKGMSSLALAVSGDPRHPDEGTREGNSFMVFRRPAR